MHEAECNGLWHIVCLPDILKHIITKREIEDIRFQARIRLVARTIRKVLVVELTQVLFEFQFYTMWKLDTRQESMLETFLPVTKPTGDLINFIAIIKGLFLVMKRKLHFIPSIEKQIGQIAHFDPDRECKVVRPKFFLVDHQCCRILVVIIDVSYIPNGQP